MISITTCARNPFQCIETNVLDDKLLTDYNNEKHPHCSRSIKWHCDSA